MEYPAAIIARQSQMAQKEKPAAPEDQFLDGDAGLLTGREPILDQLACFTSHEQQRRFVAARIAA